jgi:hypothetical protein
MKTKEILLDKKGNYTFKKWALKVVRNAKEEKENWLNRQQTFNDLFIKMWEEHQLSEDPAQSDTNY